ncbi:MAG TPA: hypothetical protein VIZ43_08495 [Trebonia sp.]
MNAGWTCAEREALSRTSRPLQAVLGIIEQVPCEVHEAKPGRFCDPRACLARAETAGLANLITGAEFGLIAGMQ